MNLHKKLTFIACKSSSPVIFSLLLPSSSLTKIGASSFNAFTLNNSRKSFRSSQVGA